MLKKPLSALLFILTVWLFSKSAIAGNLNKKVLLHDDNSGAIHDVCLHDQIPITIKQIDPNLYFVDVQNRYTGKVRAGSYGEARNIACSKKTDLILYNNDK